MSVVEPLRMSMGPAATPPAGSSASGAQHPVWHPSSSTSLSHAHSHAFIVNAGLPRTGTTSFSAATRLVGMQALHSWEPHQPLGTEDRRDRWWREQYEQVLLGNPGELIRYDSLSDNPFMFQTARFRSAYPNATIVCTTRDRSTWVQSMLKCKPHNCAGGVYLLRQFPQFPLGYPYRNDSATVDLLSAVFDLHYRTECADATLLDLRWNSSELWHRLCSAVPARYTTSCWRQVAAGQPWPGTREISPENPKGSTSSVLVSEAALSKVEQQRQPRAVERDFSASSSLSAICPTEAPGGAEHLPPPSTAFTGTCPAWARTDGISTPLSSCAESTIVGQGFGSYFHRVAQAVLFTSRLERRYVPRLHPRVRDYSPLMVNSSKASYDHACRNKQHSCLFEVPAATSCRNTSSLGTVYPGLRLPEQYGLTQQTFFREVSATVSTLLIPKERLRTALAPPATSSLCIAVQIRAGDSCIQAAVRRKCDPLVSYLNATMVLVHRYHLHDIVVASDSASERQKFISMLPTWLRVTTPPTEPSELYGDSLLERQTTVEQRWHENASAGVSDLRSFLTDVDKLAACSAFVGKLTSNVARLVLEVMSARRGRVVPYVSLDAAWCFGGRAANPEGWNSSAFPCI